MALPTITPGRIALTPTPAREEAVITSPGLIGPFADDTVVWTSPVKPTGMDRSPRFSPPRNAGWAEVTPTIAVVVPSQGTTVPFCVKQTTAPKVIDSF